MTFDNFKALVSRAEHLSSDEFGALCCVIVIVVIAVNFLARKRRANRVGRGGGLETPLMSWDKFNSLSVRDLINGGLAVFGRSGSGKTSCAINIARAILRHRSGGLILAGKSSDLAMWRRLFKEAGRADDLIVFGPNSPERFNFIDYMYQLGGSTREIVRAIMVIGETLRSSGGRGSEDGKYWENEQQRMLHNAIECVKQATGRVSAPDIQRFIASAPLTPAEVQTPAWQNGFCNQCLKAAHAKQKSPIEAHDFEIAMTYFAGEFPTMADRTRSSITVGVMGILFVFNTGICRDLISRETTISPDVTLQGKWILVDMPVSEHGDNGALIGAGFKYLTQRMVLLRQPAETDYIIVIWVDEAATAVTTYDAIYLSQSRSHLGASIYLMQSLDGLYSAMQGESGKHEINSLLTNFATGKLFFALGDEISANYAAGLCGKRRETFVGTSLQPADNLWDELYGQGRFSTSTSEHYEFAVKPHEFMNGLRTGGAANKLICDSVLVRSGVPFANGSNHLFISWSQE